MLTFILFFFFLFFLFDLIFFEVLEVVFIKVCVKANTSFCSSLSESSINLLSNCLFSGITSAKL